MVNTQFTRTQMLLGRKGIERLSNCSVAVFGVGGVGSFAVEALARAGIGHLRLIDFDVVDITNLNRQLHALHTTIGQPKAVLMADRVKLINPRINVEAVVEKVTPENVGGYLDGMDYIVDAIDMVSAKVALLETCYRRQIPVISSMGAGNRLDPTKLQVTDISKTHTCPLAKVVRKELRQRGITRGITVVFSTEPPRKVEGLNVRAPGSVPFVPSVAGLIIASVVVRELAGIESEG